MNESSISGKDALLHKKYVLKLGVHFCFSFCMFDLLVHCVNYFHWVLSCNMKSHLIPLFYVHLRCDVLPYLHLPLSLLQIPGRFMRAEHIQLLKKYSRDVTEAQMMSKFLGG